MDINVISGFHGVTVQASLLLSRTPEAKLRKYLSHHGKFSKEEIQEFLLQSIEEAAGGACPAVCDLCVQSQEPSLLSLTLQR